ncbi:MAG: hypothetical protein ACYTF1_00265 [Planctomycetota bacterium]|jgi:hypothetical protein
MISKNFPAGTKVKVAKAVEVPLSSKWDDDRGRISTPAKKKLLQRFFEGDEKITAEILYVSKESERNKLKKAGQIKIRLRESSGATLIITVDPEILIKA